MTDSSSLGQQRGAAVGGVGLQVVVGRDGFARGLAHRVEQPAQRILVGGPHLGGGQAQAVGDGAEQLRAGVGRRAC